MGREVTVYRSVEGMQRGQPRRTDWRFTEDEAKADAKAAKFLLPSVETSTIIMPAPTTPVLLGVVCGFDLTEEMLEDTCWHCGVDLVEADDKMFCTCRNCRGF